MRAGETARDIIPGARDLERLRREQATLRAALDDPLSRSKLADVAEVEAAYRRVTAELARFRPAVDSATQAVVTQSSVTEVSIRSTLALANAYLESASAGAAPSGHGSGPQALQACAKRGFYNLRTIIGKALRRAGLGVQSRHLMERV